MTEKNPDQDQTITPAGQIELNEEELDQAVGGGRLTSKIPGIPMQKEEGTDEVKTFYDGWPSK